MGVRDSLGKIFRPSPITDWRQPEFRCRAIIHGIHCHKPAPERNGLCREHGLEAGLYNVSCRVEGCKHPVRNYNPYGKWTAPTSGPPGTPGFIHSSSDFNARKKENEMKDLLGYCDAHVAAMYYVDGDGNPVKGITGERRFNPVAPPSPKRRGDIRADYLSDAMMYLTLILSLILWYYKFEIKNQLTNDFDGFSWGCCLYLILLPFVMILLSGSFDWFAYTLITGNEYEKEP